MRHPELAGLTMTYREPPTAWQFLVTLAPVLIGASLIGSFDHASDEVQLLAWAAFATVAVLTGLLGRRAQAAVRLTDAGVRVRGFASRWRYVPWSEIQAVAGPSDSTKDASLCLTDGTRVRLHGIPPATAETLAQRLLDIDHTTERAD